MASCIYSGTGLLLFAQDTDFWSSVWQVLQHYLGCIETDLKLPMVFEIRSDLWLVTWLSCCPRFPPGSERGGYDICHSWPPPQEKPSLSLTAQWWNRYSKFHGLLPPKYTFSDWYLLTFCSHSHWDPFWLLSSTTRVLTRKLPKLGTLLWAWLNSTGIREFYPRGLFGKWYLLLTSAAMLSKAHRIWMQISNEDIL